jgi:hypothetical protein
VDEPSQHVATPDRACVRCLTGGVLRTDGRGQVQPAMRPLPVVVLDIDPEHPLQVSAAEDEHPIQALRPDRADPALGEGVRPWGPDWGADHLGPIGPEDLVEARGVFGVAVPDQEPEGPPTFR